MLVLLSILVMQAFLALQAFLAFQGIEPILRLVPGHKNNTHYRLRQSAIKSPPVALDAFSFSVEFEMPEIRFGTVSHEGA